ncbi:hypothetical protein IRZ71_21245 [Flavobacterium sp. ANB]|uniref:DUF6193 family natural product biosynthesis protein n=1 Tax=unclassified Flavobacterium TaxID=196869 RepID=UPI0012B9B93B|nr:MULTISPECIES: DUF6193 family natural product biosynthesis protein [unclassified Flavobacterium]MBF4518890.1 hypothetical protein [Flavobacterium sp. ANB]MTD71397.1 hypothetical protein [Flavobacterium sp. LC2016-13]
MEIKETGGISVALNREFARINSSLKVLGSENGEHINLTSAIVENENKFSQIGITDKKDYGLDFWRDGVYLAVGRAKDIQELAKVLDFWLCQDVTTKSLCENFTFVRSEEGAAEFDEGREIEYIWTCFLEKDDNYSGLSEFIILAAKDPILSNLFPFTSMDTLCFSKCTGYPFDIAGMPNIIRKEFDQGNRLDVNPNNKIQYVVRNDTRDYLGEGNAIEALKIIKDNMPKNIQRARKGVALE